MPFEEEELKETLQVLIEYSNKRIFEKLGDIASVENLLELRTEFEKRIHSYFKSVFQTNFDESRTQCLNLLSSLEQSQLNSIKINDIQDIHPSMMSSFKNGYVKMFIEYIKAARGPYKA